MKCPEHFCLLSLVVNSVKSYKITDVEKNQQPGNNCGILPLRFRIKEVIETAQVST